MLTAYVFVYMGAFISPFFWGLKSEVKGIINMPVDPSFADTSTIGCPWYFLNGL